MLRFLILLAMVSGAMQRPQYTTRIFLNNPTKYAARQWELTDSVVLDTASFQIYYQLEFISDTTTNHSDTTVMVAEFGTKFIQYYSLAKRINNISYTRLMEKRRKITPGLGVPLSVQLSDEEARLYKFAGNADRLNSEIWIDRQALTLTERAADYAAENSAHEYTEPIPAIEWHISDQTQTIVGYDCVRADARFAGREWSVWFAPEIPLPFGPWKLCGLPGLILKATDAQGHYVWECCGIEKIDRSMNYFKVRTKKHTKVQFRRWMRNYHNHPYEMIDGGSGTVLIQTRAEGGEWRTLDQSWTIPYNPIERE